MAIQEGDIIGEDTLWFESDAFYSARPQKCNVKTICVTN